MHLTLFAASLPATQKRGRMPAFHPTQLKNTTFHQLRALLTPDRMSMGEDILIEPSTHLALTDTPHVSAALRNRHPGQWAERALSALSSDDLRQWCHVPEFAPPGGESLLTMRTRLAPWLDDRSSTKGHELVIAHPLVIRMLVLIALDGTWPQFSKIEILPETFGRLTCHSSTWRLVSLGSALAER